MKKWLILLMMGMVLAGVRPAEAQVRDNVWNGAVIGGLIGGAAGVLFTHAVRDSDLTAGQYAYGAAVFGGIGAGVGMGIDVMLFRNQPRRPEKQARVLIAPAVWKNTKAVAVKWRW